MHYVASKSIFCSTVTMVPVSAAFVALEESIAQGLILKVRGPKKMTQKSGNSSRRDEMKVIFLLS